MSNMRIFYFGALVGWRDFSIFWNWKTWTLGWLVRVGAAAATWVLLGRVVGSEDLVRFLLIGNIISAGAGAAAFAIPASTWDRNDGTYPLLIVAPNSVFLSILGRTIVWGINGILTSFAALVILNLVFSQSFDNLPFKYFALAITIACFSAYCFSALIGTLITPYPQIRNIALTLVAFTITAICGVSVPVSFWPEMIQWIAEIMPVTHALHGTRALISGSSQAEFFKHLLFEAFVGTGWLLLGLLLIKGMINRGRKKGSVDFQ
jgi:ABC-2 type transport system permease protein